MKKNKKVSVKHVERPSGLKIGLAFAGMAALIALVIMMSLPEKKLVFNFVENMGMWQLSEGSTYRQVDDSIQLIKGGNQLYVVIPQLVIDADYYDVCVIEGAWPVAYDQGHLLFISPFNRHFDYNFRHDFDTGPADKVNRHYINLRDHPAWQSLIRAILILPGKDARRVTLKRISFIKANPWTKIKAWWSDFTRYSDPLLGSCFAMATPILMGRPFNPLIVPALWGMLVIFGLISSGVYWLKADRRITKIALIIFLAAVIFAWGLLEIKNDVYYLEAITRDIGLYWGKSIQEKRGIVVGDPEFIRFM